LSATDPAAALDAAVGADRRRRHRQLLPWAAAAAAALLSCVVVGAFDPARYADGYVALRTIAIEMMPPDMTRWRDWLPALGETLAMSVSATALALVAALPLGACAAATLSPHAACYRLARGLLGLFRALPELALGVLLVAAVGFGALPGTLALAIHSAGMMGKFFAETFEHVDRGTLEAAQSTGADGVAVFLRVILPASLPRLVDILVYRWEHNIRASAILGMVGAGGIGYELISALRILSYREAAALLILIFALVLLIDAAGAALRRRLA